MSARGEKPAIDGLSPALLDIVQKIPKARVRRSAEPEAEARRIAQRAAAKAALVAGTLALPTGPLGWLTLLPELRSVWRIQVQLVADIAALHGRKSQLTPEQVLYCLFAPGAALVLRDLVVRVGDRFLVRKASTQLLQYVVRKLALRLAQRLVGKGLSRWLPVVGAAGVGAYVFHETTRVGAAAVELFGAPVEIEDGELSAPPAARA